MKFFRHILDFLLPPRCICCGKIIQDENGICAECFNQITFITAPYCQRCGLPFTETFHHQSTMLCPRCIREKHPLLGMCRSAVKYNDFSKNPILALKFMDKTENAKVLAKWLKIAGKDIFEDGAELIIPVPLHYFRLIKRRYNQSALLATALSALTGIPVDTSALIKHKSTKPQVSFSGHQRIQNIKGVFSVKYPEKIKGKHIVIIDDVFTTGSTVRECAKVLRAAGAKRIDVLTVARVYD